MSVVRALVYEIHCDNCNAALDPYDDGVLLFTTAKEAKTWLLNDFEEQDDWTTDGLLIHCSKCPPLEEGPEAEAERARLLEATGPDLFGVTS